MVATSGRSEDVIYVGIGASAGGLDAIKELLRQLTQPDGLVLILAQHLSPNYDSMLVPLLKNECGYSVETVIHGAEPVPSTLYVTPPKHDVELRHGRFVLEEVSTRTKPTPYINRLLSSLASEYGNNAAGVILSGTGSDGAQGMYDIKQAGGVALVQNPETAQYDGMPSATIQRQAYQAILDASEIGETLNRLAIDRELPEDTADDGYNVDAYWGIIGIIEEETGISFREYKASTILRRLRRRITLLKIDDFDAYRLYLEKTPNEVEDLVNDIFISVTEFFRDSAAFTALQSVVDPLLRAPQSGNALRVWVAGCASGEEAYSIAILLEESMQRLGVRRDYKIFATDIASEPLVTARLGSYGQASMRGLEPRLIDTYFDDEDEKFTVKKSLRERIIFSRHNVMKDPPFSNVDLVCCRNMLIYFNQSLQRQVLETFHYALKSGGYLFLGNSESVGHLSNIFEETSRRHKLYKRLEASLGVRNTQLIQASKRSMPGRGRKRDVKIDPFTHAIYKRVVESVAPPTLVVNPDDDLEFAYGSARRILKIPDGTMSLCVFDIVPTNLRATLRALLYRSRRQPSEVIRSGRETVQVDDDTFDLVISVTGLGGEYKGWTLLHLMPVKEVAQPVLAGADLDADDHAVMRHLEGELTATRENLQTVIEELETANEELQSTNEELLASNEEFNSTNEELQTTNEELQSTNEELITVNDELVERNRQYEALAMDLQNIQESVSHPLLVVDRMLRVTRFVFSVDKIIDTSDMREEDPLTALRWRGEIPNLREFVMEAIEQDKTLHQPVQFGEKTYLMQVSPYHSQSKNVLGAVLYFTETSDLVSAKQALQVAREHASVTLRWVRDAVIWVDMKLTVEQANPAAAQLLDQQADMRGASLADLIPLADEPEQNFSVWVEQALLYNKSIQGDVALDLDGSPMTCRYAIAPTLNGLGKVNGAIIVLSRVVLAEEPATLPVA